MPDSLFRRRTKGWGQTTLHSFVGALIVITFLSGAAMIANALFPYIYIDLKSHSVDESHNGDDPMVTAYRTIHKDFEGTWVVRIRNAETERLVCVVPRVIKDATWLTYRERANKVNPLHMPLSEWIGTPEQLRDCEADGFWSTDPNGTHFYLVTCHIAKVLGVFPLKKCRDSAVFLRRPQPGTAPRS